MRERKAFFAPLGNLIRTVASRKEAVEDKQLERIEESLNRVDFLAQVRTDLANERTMLAYIRTSSSLFLLAVALMRFFDDPTYIRIGFGICVASVVVLVVGFLRYAKMNTRIRNY